MNDLHSGEPGNDEKTTLKLMEGSGLVDSENEIMQKCI